MKISTNCFHCSFFFTLPFFSLIFILIFSMLYLPRSISILWNWCRCFFFILRMRKRKPCIFLSESVKYRVVIYEERLWFWRVCRELGKPCHWFLLCFSCGCFICFFFYKMGCKLHVWMPKWTLSFIIFKIHVCFGFGICLFLFMILVLSYLLHLWCFFLIL